MIYWIGALDEGWRSYDKPCECLQLQKACVSRLILWQDGSLKRCYGVDKKVIECDWSYIKTLRTVIEPHQPMPTLEDVLLYLSEPDMEKIWLMLDIKVCYRRVAGGKPPHVNCRWTMTPMT